MQNSVAKKLFAVGVAASTVLLGLAPFAASAAAHAEGTNVKKSDGTVGMIIGGQFRPYTSAGAFLSYGFNSWAGVVDANADDLALPTGAFIPPQDGKIICSDRGTDKGTCYLISGAQKAGFTSAAVFTGLGFSFSRAQYGDVSWMPSTSNIDNTTASHLPGVLVNNSGTVQLVGSNGLLGIPDIATFNGWGYSFADVVPANSADKAMTQTGVMASRVAGQLSPTALANVPSVVSGSVSASLASDTPAAGSLAVSSTASVNTVATLAKFNFSGSGTVTQLQVKRIGISADTDLSNVYLFDGSTRLTDAASVGANSLVTFSNPNGLFTVSGNKTISVVAELKNNASAGITVGVQLTSFTVANGTPATVAVSGNLFSVTNVGTDLAYGDFGSVTPTGGSYDPAKDVEVFRSNLTVNTRNMTLSGLILRQIGSANNSDINNFRLRIDGTQVAQVQSVDSNGYVNFSFAPVTLQSGTRVVSVLADVVGGSSRTFQFQIRNKADVVLTDSNYGTQVSTNDTYPVGSAAANDINAGSLTIQKATDSPSADVTANSNDVTLAKYTLTAYGEPMKVETLTVAATSSDVSVTSLRNGRVLVNGAQYGSTATLARCTTCADNDAGGTAYTLNYTVNPGTPVIVEVHADLYDNDGANNLGNGDTVTAYILEGSSNVQKTVSLGYGSYPTNTVVAGNSLSVVTGSMTLSSNSNYANQKISLPQTSYKLGSFNLVGSSSEDINISSIGLAMVASTTLTSLNDVQIKVNGNMFGTIKSTVAAGTGPNETIGATSTFSGNYTLPKLTTVPVEVYGTINTPTSGYTNDHFQVRLSVDGTTASSATTAESSNNGQTISIGSASIVAAKDASSPVASLVAGNQTKTAAAFKFTTTDDAYTVKEITFTPTNVTTITSVILKDGNTVLGTQPGGTATVTFSGLNISIPANSSKVLTVDLQLGAVGYGQGTSGDNVQIQLTSYKNVPSSTGVQATNTTDVPSGNAMYVVKAVPTITPVTLPTGLLGASGQVYTIAKFQVSTGGTGTIAFTHLVFKYSTTTGVDITTPKLYDANSVEVTSSSSVDKVNSRIVVDLAAEKEVTDGTFSLKATLSDASGFTTGDSVSTYMDVATSSVTKSADAGTATSTIANAFVWSDESGTAGTSATHSLTSDDWFGDYLIKNLPTDSQNLVK
ncbi:MAG: hypothetical protein M1383_01850 [Patescibacteria group bacterium]|nr:hypothetical protein [Patescibacteria group bacterium]